MSLLGHLILRWKVLRHRYLSRRRRDIVIKGKASFANQNIYGDVSVASGGAATFVGCYIQAPATVTLTAGGTFGNSSSANSGHLAATVAPVAAPLDIIERTTPIIGFRGWAVRGDLDDGVVLSATNERFGYWRVNAATEARCNAMRGPLLLGRDQDLAPEVHEAPHQECGCGLYLMRRLDDVGAHTGFQTVMGAVVSWGRIIEHTDGFRAQYARPLALLAGSKLAEVAARELGLPLLSREHLETYAKEFGELM